MQKKTTRAFRTISEAGEELDLQPHVLRFWESKFPQIKPIKRGGGRRFYRPEDIEFLRGIKTLLHDEKHPIKDVQKLIRMKGPQRVTELGQSVERASQEKEVSETVLIPKRIVKAESDAAKRKALDDLSLNDGNGDDLARDKELGDETPHDSPNETLERKPEDSRVTDNRIVHFPPRSEKKPLFKPRRVEIPSNKTAQGATESVTQQEAFIPSGPSEDDIAATKELEAALKRLQVLRSQWQTFKENS